MTSQVQDVLNQMGLSEGYHIPIANAENIKLEAELQKLILAKAKASTTLESITSRCNGLNNHMKYVRTEQLENQNLLLARNTQLESEKHMYTMVKLEREHVSQDIRKMTGDLMKLDENKQNKCINLKSLMSRMDKLKISVKWDEQVIQALEESVLKKDNDNELLKKFSKEDQRRADELEIKRKKLREEELARRQLVIRLANEIECLHLTLGRNVQMYKQMHDERNAMIRQWHESVRQLQQRNKDTIALVGETSAVRDVIAVNNQALEEQKQFAQNERANNYELELHINTESTNVARVRARLNSCSAFVQNQAAELGGALRELRQTANALEGERVDKRRTYAMLEAEQNMLQSTLTTNDNLRKQLLSVKDSGMSAEERTRRLEEIIREEEANTNIFMYDIERVQGVLFRSQKALVELTDAFKVQEMQQRVQENSLITLQRQTTQAETESRQSAEVMYKLNFRINMLENRFARLSGDHRDNNNDEHHLRIRELDKTLTSVMETSNLLQTQIARIEDDMRRMSASSISDAEHLQMLRDRLHDRLLMVNGAFKLVAQKRGSNNMLRVEQNVLAVRVKGAEKSLKREGGVIYSLQRQKMELEAAVLERQSEITMERELLLVKKRALQEDTGRMRLDLQGRRIKVEQLKKRLDCILASLGKSEDGEALSVTYFRVRNAQEKYALQQEGDRLDGLIRKAEREIIAMENTLRVVNGTNEAYKKSLDLLEDDAEELAELKRLEEKLKQLGIETRTQSSFLADRGKTIRAVRANLEDIRVKYQEVVETRAEKKKKYDEIHTEEIGRKTKLDRATASISVTECSCGDEFKDMAMRQLQEVNKSALQQLSETCIRHIETEPVLNRYLSEHKIELSLKPSVSFVSGSNRSSRSSKSSASTKSDNSSSSSGIPSVMLTLNIP